MAIVVKAPPQILDLVSQIKEKNHPKLNQASIAVCVSDMKPFRANKINLGKATKFSHMNKIWQGTKYDFCLVLCADVYYQILNDAQREAYLDLLLSCCDVEYEPLTEDVNGKAKVVKDEWGRVKYSEDIKVDDNGEPKWRVQSLDFLVFADNADRYGIWLKEVIEGLDNLEVNKK